MKNIFFVIVAFLWSSLFFAQDINNKLKTRFGVFVGINRLTNSSPPKFYTDVEEFKADLGFQLGGNVNIPMSEHFSFQPELMFQRIGFSTKYYSSLLSVSEISESSLKSNYLQIPLNFKYAFNEKFNVDLGSNIGFLLSSKFVSIDRYKFNNEIIEKEIIIEDGARKYLYGANIGLNYNINQIIYVNLRNAFYVGEFSFIDDIFRNSFLTLNLGYYFK